MSARVKLIAPNGPLIIIDAEIIGSPAQESRCFRDFTRRMPRAAIPPRISFEPFNVIFDVCAEQDIAP